MARYIAIMIGLVLTITLFTMTPKFFGEESEDLTGEMDSSAAYQESRTGVTEKLGSGITKEVMALEKTISNAMQYQYQQDTIVERCSRRIVELLKATGDSVSVARHYFIMAAKYDAVLRPDEARSFFRKGHSAFEALGDSLYMHRCLAGIGHTFHQLQSSFYNPDSGIYYHSLARDYFATHDNKARLAGQLGGIAECLIRRNDQPERLRLRLEAYNLSMAAGDSSTAAWALSLIPLDFAAAGQVDSAIFYQNTLLELDSALGGIPVSLNMPVNQYAKVTLGDFLVANGDTAMAIELWNEWLMEQKDTNTNPNVLFDNCIRLFQISNRLMGIRAYSSALDILRQEKSICDQSGNTFAVGNSLTNMAICYSFLEQKDSADYYFKQSLSEFENDVYGRSALIHRYAQFALHEGRFGNQDQAVMHLNEATQMATETGEPHNSVSALLSSAEYYLSIDDTSQALSMLEQALVQGRKSDVWNNYEYLAQIGFRFRQADKPRRALECFNLAIEQMDTLKNIDWFETVTDHIDSANAIINSSGLEK